MRSLPINLLGILLLLAIWQWFGAQMGEALLATPLQVAQALTDVVGTGALWTALWQMLWQMLLGYLLALFIGIPLGAAMGRNATVDAVAKPWASMFIVISVAALVPLFIILLGRGIVFSTAVVFVGTVWYVVITMTQASRAVSPKLIDVARSFGASDLQRFRHVILPALHPYCMIAARIGLIHALRAMITAQMFIGTGFGGLMVNAGLDLSTAGLFALVVILMVLSISATKLLRLAADWSAPWYRDKTQIT